MSAGYVDLQVNGYAGIDFNATEPVSDQQAIEVAEKLTADGVEAILLQLIGMDFGGEDRANGHADR